MVKQGHLRRRCRTASGRAAALCRRLAGQDPAAPHFVTYVRAILEEAYGPEMVNAGGLVVTTTLDLDLQHAGRVGNRAAAHRPGAAGPRGRRAGPQRPQRRAGGARPGRPARSWRWWAAPTTSTTASTAPSTSPWPTASPAPRSSRSPTRPPSPSGLSPGHGHPRRAPHLRHDGGRRLRSRELRPAPGTGPISLREALATSSNMSAVRVLDRIGLPAMMRDGQRPGHHHPGRNPTASDLALTLGGGEVRLLELTAAYAAFANDGPSRRGLPAILDVWQAIRRDMRWAARPAGRPPGVSAAGGLPDHRHPLRRRRARMPAFGEGSVPAAQPARRRQDRHHHRLARQLDRRLHAGLAVGVWVGNADNEPMVHTPASPARRRSGTTSWKSSLCRAAGDCRSRRRKGS